MERRAEFCITTVSDGPRDVPRAASGGARSEPCGAARLPAAVDRGAPPLAARQRAASGPARREELAARLSGARPDRGVHARVVRWQSGTAPLAGARLLTALSFARRRIRAVRAARKL